MQNHAHAMPDAPRRDRATAHADPPLSKADLAAQLARRADEWVRRASPGELLSVLLSGGLSPVIVEEQGHIRTGIDLGKHPGLLSQLGIVWSDLPPAQTLPIVAVVWDATPPPADNRLWEAWIALDGHAREGARRFLQDEIDQNIPLFEACAEAWLREN